MHVEVVDRAPGDSDACLICVGLFEGESLSEPFASAAGAGDVGGEFKKVAVVHPDPPERALVVGLGKPGEFEPERARVAASLSAREARRLQCESLSWVLPDHGDAARVGSALVEGAVLGSYRFDRYRRPEDGGAALQRVEILAQPAADELAQEVETARIASEATNRARELQNLPANVATPSYLAERAAAIAAERERCSVDVLGREQLERCGMGGLIAVSRGTAEEPQLIVLRYAGASPAGDRSGISPPALDGPIGLVGKGVTFDSGGISIKPSARMHEMKMDMSGGAAVLEAVDAIAELGLELDLIAVIPCTENMPSGTATKPGDIITQLGGKTVEITNTDAEGRLILADALAHCVELGATRIVDLATLTGGVLVALGSTYAALIANDDEWAAQVLDACERTGELAWRLPLHAEFKELTKGTITDLVNSSEKRKASTIYGGSFLEEFVGAVPWAHLDIAGTAWDVGREYVGKGATGYGVRLLVALARDLAAR